MFFHLKFIEGRKIGTFRSRRMDDIKMNVKGVRCMHELLSSG
jgi:hypothetical protein